MRQYLATGLVLCAGAAAAMARPEIPVTAFSPTATVINFDALAGGSSLTTGEIITTQFLPLGVEFRNPDLLTRANTSLAGLAAGQSDPNIAFCAQGGGGTPGIRPQEVIFSTPVTRFGCWLGGSQSTTYTIAAYDSAGALLEAISKPLPSTGSLTEGFIGIERTEGIAKVLMSCKGGTAFPFNFSFDDVRFEGAKAACFVDCSGDGKLDVQDFTCFQNAFALGDLAKADCNKDGKLDITDFTCFQNQFALGCK